ncbi:MAG: PAS domain S-box protein [Planctomycetaceae bacterium]|nr:PAS domain S-box protein [Planctomycetaceae bacterium]
MSDRPSELAILIVDDDPGIRSSLSRILKQDGYRIDQAESADQALSRDNWQDYFAILLDRRLPGGMVDDLLPEIVARAGDAAVLIITGYADLDSSLAAIRAGASDYLLKPVDPDALRVRLKMLADLKFTRDEVRKRDAQVQFMIEHLPAGAAYVDNASGALLINRTVEKMTGYTDDELPTRDSWFRILFGGRGEEYRQQYEADRARLFPETRILNVITKDGREILTEFNAYQYDEHEVWMVQDVTERIRVQEELRQQRDFSNRLLETAQVIILVLDPEARIVRFNRFMQELSGYEQSEVIGQDWIDTFISKDESRRVHELFKQVVAGEEVRGHVNAIRTRDGRERQIAWWGKPLYDSEGKTTEVLSIGHDITDLRDVQEKLVQSERLAAIGQMIAGLAHESRNALQRAQACLDMLSLDLSEQPKQIELTQRIEAALTELRRLYEEVRSYAAPVKLSLGPCDLAELWRMSWHHILQTHQDVAVSLVELMDDVSTQCIADSHRLEQVFRNVLENAVSASPQGGKVTVTCEDVNLEGKPAIQISIADEGPGLSTEEQARVFEPFYTTKQKGTGLGMAICQRIVNAHDGTIGVSTRRGGGACVVITLRRSINNVRSDS